MISSDIQWYSVIFSDMQWSLKMQHHLVCCRWPFRHLVIKATCLVLTQWRLVHPSAVAVAGSKTMVMSTKIQETRQNPTRLVVIIYYSSFFLACYVCFVSLHCFAYDESLVFPSPGRRENVAPRRQGRGGRTSGTVWDGSRVRWWKKDILSPLSFWNDFVIFRVFSNCMLCPISTSFKQLTVFIWSFVQILFLYIQGFCM